MATVDAGSPLLIPGTNIIMGVYSFGRFCGLDGVDVFAKISNNFHWISLQANFPPTPPPTPAPTMKPTRDHPSSDSGSKDDVRPSPAPSPTYVPCHWLFDLGDAIFGFTNTVGNFFGGGERI